MKYLFSLLGFFLLIAPLIANVITLDSVPINQNLLTKRNTQTTGFIPTFIPTETKRFPKTIWEKNKSELGLKYQPANPEDKADVKIITPNITSWDQADFNNPDIKLWLLIPADYSHLGPMLLTAQGDENSIKVIRPYYINNNNPYKLIHGSKVENESEEIIIDGIIFENAAYWTVSSVTIGGENTYSDKFNVYGSYGVKMIDESHHNIVVNSLFKQWAGNGAAVTISNSHHNLIQHCLFKDPFALGPDTGGVLLFATKNKEARGNMILASEFYNVADAVGMTFGTGQGDLQKIGEVPATIIANNDMYYDETHPAWMTIRNQLVYVEETICGENAIDIKNGTSSTDPLDKIIIAFNRMWGYRPTDQTCGGSGSGGEAIVIHLNAKNILVYENIIYDAVMGIYVKQGKEINGVIAETENIAIVNNLIFGMVNPIPDFSETYGGIGIVTTSEFNFQMYFNTIHSTDKAFELKVKYTYRIQCNTIINAKTSSKYPQDTDSWGGLNSWLNYPSLNPNVNEIYAHGPAKDSYFYSEEIDDGQLTDFSFYIRRYTGNQLITLPAVAPKFTGGPQVEEVGDCNCFYDPCGASWMGVELANEN